MNLSRRELLATSSITLLPAGCLAMNSSAGNPTANEPKFQLDASVATSPTDPLELTTDVTTSEITPETPGKLAVAFTNTDGDSYEVNLAPREPHPRTSESESPGILLEYPGKNEKERTDCWMPDDDSISSRLGQPFYDLPAGESVQTEYQLWAHPQGKPEYECLVPGTYRVSLPESAMLAVELTDF